MVFASAVRRQARTRLDIFMATNGSEAAMEHPSGFQVVHAPQPFNDDGLSIFLSGSISMIDGEHWQTRIAKSLSGLPVTVLDPYRPDWNASWKEDISFAPFKQQVEWELDMQERASIIAVYFGAEAKAPISLLELGLFARSKKTIVACPDGYWKKGNVQIVCARFGIELVEDMDQLIQEITKRLNQ